MTDEKSLSRQAVEGTLVLMVTRFVVRLIGFVSVSFTARLLTPEDFGVVGAASIVIALFAVFNQIGLGDYIARSPDIKDSEVHTLWTMRLGINAALSVLLVVLAPQAADFLQDDRLIEVIRVLAIVFFLGAVRAPATEFFNRDLNYQADLLLKAADKVVSVVATIAIAYYFRTYWALVWGSLIGSVFSILSSYVAWPFVPRLTLRHVSKLGNFTFWSTLVNVNNHGINQVDEWIAKRSSDTAVFGAYHISRDLCRLFVSEILAPAGQVFLPSLSRVQHDDELMKEAVKRFIGAALIVVFAVAVGIAAIAPELVYLLLGYQWVRAIPFLPYAAIGTAAVVLVNMFGGLYVLKDKQNIAVRFRFMRFAALLAACSIAASVSGLLAVAQAYAAVAIITTMVELMWLFAPHRYGVRLAPLVWRPFLAALAMFAGVTFLSLPQTWPLPLIVFPKVLLGAVLYLAVLGLLWRVAGRPVGGEEEMLTRVREFLPSWRKS